MSSQVFDLRVIDLQKRFDGFELGPVSLDVPQGSVVGLIGQNGAGKTTLMKLVLGMLHPSAGHIELFGQDLATASERQRQSLMARVGYVAAESAYPLDMTLREVARMHKLAYPHFDSTQFQELCQQMELTDPSRKTKDLSRGMGMKLQLACAIAAGVSLLVLDEPTAGLDPIVRADALDVLRTWMEPGDRSVLISSHITSDLEHLADYLVMIHDGQVRLRCDQDELAAMGVARLRTAELDHVLASERYGKGSLRLLSRDLSRELLVPDRAAFQRAHPNFVCDRASIDDVMAFVAKGQVI